MEEQSYDGKEYSWIKWIILPATAWCLCLLNVMLVNSLGLVEMVPSEDRPEEPTFDPRLTRYTNLNHCDGFDQRISMAWFERLFHVSSDSQVYQCFYDFNLQHAPMLQSSRNEQIPAHSNLPLSLNFGSIHVIFRFLSRCRYLTETIFFAVFPVLCSASATWVLYSDKVQHSFNVPYRNNDLLERSDG